ncbi:hypothetical protein MLM30_07550 [Escherichia coli]|nr:hypothetical protein [Escherichia coli]
MAGYCAARAASGDTTAGPCDHLPPAAYRHSGRILCCASCVWRYDCRAV